MYWNVKPYVKKKNIFENFNLAYIVEYHCERLDVECQEKLRNGTLVPAKDFNCFDNMDENWTCRAFIFKMSCSNNCSKIRTNME